MNPYSIYLLTSVLELDLMAKATDLLAGHCRKVGFGAVISAMVSGYVYAIFTVQGHCNVWLALLASVGVAVLLGFGLAILLTNLDADSYLLATFALQLALVEVVNNSSFTGGPLGIRNIPAPRFPGLTLDSDVSSLLILLGTGIPGAIFLARILGKASSLARILHWIRDDYSSAISSGVNPNRFFVGASVLHSTIASCAGIGVAVSQGYVGPQSFDLWLSIRVLTVVIISGTGGPPFSMFIGSIIVVLLTELLSSIFTDPVSVGPFQQIIINCVLAGFLLWRNRGVAGPKLSLGPSARSE